MLIDFSKDHLKHSGSLTEWWYFNGHLTASNGKNYSYAFCLFRRFPLLYFVHISFTDEASHVFTFKRKFYPYYKVKFGRQTADISYGNEQIIEQQGLSAFRIKAKLKDISLDIVLDSEKPPLLNNDNGLIDMEGGRSFYYSLTRLRTSGSIIMQGCPIPVTGNSWMDHQWGNFNIINKGWDWFSFQLEDGTDYNLYSFRNKKNETLKQFATIFDEQNKIYSQQRIIISRLDWWDSPETSNRYTTNWEIILPASNDTFFVTSRLKNQELFATKIFDVSPSYWEGACTVTKRTAKGMTIQGLGFAEQFPYWNNNKKL